LVVVPVMYSLLDRRKDVRVGSAKPAAQEGQGSPDLSRAVQAS
jgi:hypothetical protein